MPPHQPDVVVPVVVRHGDRVPLEKIVEQRQWRELPAARGRRLFCIDDQLLNTPASTLIGGLKAIAWALHPERFEKASGIRQVGEWPVASG